MKKIILKTLTSFDVNLRNSRNDAPSPRGSLLIPLLIVCFAFLPGAQAAPETALPGFNTADGDHALFSITTGVGNAAVGWYSLFSNTDGSFNTALGAGTLLSNVGDQTTGDGLENTAVGTAALLFNTTGSRNTAVGSTALENNNTANANTANGALALFTNTTGANNTAVGERALRNNDTGGFNTAIGSAALLNNVTGTFNIALGVSAGQLITGDFNIDIGNGGVGGEDATIRIGGGNQDRTFIAGIRGVATGNNNAVNVVIDSAGQLGTISSSRRFKKDIERMDKTSEAILALKPVTFHYKSDKTDTPQFGLIAEEVAEVNPNLVIRDENGAIYTVRYDAVNAMLLNEFLKEHRKVEEQQTNITQLNSKMANQAAIIAQQQKGIETLTAQLKEQAGQIQRVSAQLELNKSTAQRVTIEH